MYYVYILECADGTLYTGITTDLQRRVKEHNSSDKGAKYTRARRPVRLLYSEEYEDRSSASKREYHIKKKMGKEEKRQLIKNMI
jgi:putative endonuclease